LPLAPPGRSKGISAADLLDPTKDVAAVVRCDEIAWQLLGISMAGWNAILSVILAGIWVKAARTADRASCGVPPLAPRAGRKRQGVGFAGPPEQPRMFLDGETVGHAGDIVGDHAGQLRFIRGGLDIALPFRRQEIGLLQEQRKEVVHHPRDLGPDRHHAWRAVHAVERKAADRLQLLVQRLREADDGGAHVADVVHRLRLGAGQAVLGDGDHILDHPSEDPAQRLVPPAHLFEARIGAVHLLEGGAGDGQLHQVVLGEKARAQPVVQVVVRIGHVIGDGRHLRLGAGVGVKLQVPLGVHLGQRIGQRAVMLLVGIGAGHRAIVFRNAFKGFPGQVQPVEVGVVAFQLGHDPQRLGIVVKAAIGGHQPLHRVLAGVAEGRVAQVMRQRHRLGEVGVQAQHPGDGAGDLRHLDRMGQARAVVIALVFDEDLRLVLQPRKAEEWMIRSRSRW
jgi:hypothetical protein